MSADSTSRFLLVSALLLGVLHLVVLPPWMGEDEPWQLEYVHHVADGNLPFERGEIWTTEDLAGAPPGVLWGTYHLGSLSTAEALAAQGEILESMRANRFPERVDHDPRHGDPKTLDEVQSSDPHYHAFSQPWLYYLVSGAVVAATGADDVGAELLAGRLLSLLAYLAVVALTLSLARLVTDDARAVLVAGIVAAWMPMHVRQAAVVNNDVLVKVLVAGVVVLSARFASGRGGLRHLGLAAVLLGAGLLTKTTAAGGLAALVLALLLRPGVSRRVRFLALGGVAVVAVGAVAYWSATHNSALPRTTERFLARIGEGFSRGQMSGLLRTAVGTTNWESRPLAGWVYSLVGWLGLGAIGVALVRLTRPASWFSRRLLLLCVGLLVAQLLLIVFHGEARGRYFFPVLPALAVVIAVGGFALVPDRFRERATFATAAFFVLYEGGFVWGALIVNHYLEWGA